jgi:transposase
LIAINKRAVQLGKSGSNETRNAQIFSRRIDGLSFAAIAREFELSTETVRLTIRQMDRKAMWREIERNAQRERVALLGRSFGRFLVSFRSTN